MSSIESHGIRTPEDLAEVMESLGIKGHSAHAPLPAEIEYSCVDAIRQDIEARNKAKGPETRPLTMKQES